MNKKQQSQFEDILDKLIYASNDLQKIIEELYTNDNDERNQELMEARQYFDDRVDKLRQELFDLINKPLSNMQKFKICIGWFWVISLSIIGLREQNLLIVGLAAVFPFLIYPVWSEE